MKNIIPVISDFFNNQNTIKVVSFFILLYFDFPPTQYLEAQLSKPSTNINSSKTIHPFFIAALLIYNALIFYKLYAKQAFNTLCW